MILSELNERKYGCLMAFPSQDLAAKIQEIVKVIEDKLGPSLKEAEPDSHVTVLWGFSNDDPTPIKKLFGTQGPISATLGDIEKFSNDGEDVIHIAVKSPTLYELNKKAKTLPHKESEFDYHPHLTLAYVEPGSCDGLLGWNPGFGAVTFDKLIFSSSTKDKTTIVDSSNEQGYNGMSSSYGNCPECGAEGVERERRPNGNDKCSNGHSYPSKDAVKDQRNEPSR